MIGFALLTMVSVRYAKETAPAVRQRPTGATEAAASATRRAA